MHGTERINGVDLFVRRFGDPALPTLVIVHGGPGWDHSYLLPAAELRDIRHVVFFDLRGCGRSTREADLQPDLIADDVAALVGAGRRGDVLGHSYGGGVAMRVADQHPERLKPARPPDPVRALTGRPVLVVHGEHDMTFPLAAAVRLRAALPGSSLRVVAEAGHMPQFDNPGEWLAAIRGFLARR